MNKSCEAIGLALVNGKWLVSMALGLCTSLVPLQAQLLPAHPREPSALALQLWGFLSALSSLGMDWICQCLQITYRYEGPGPCSAVLEHHVTLGQECNEGTLESIPFHCWEEGTYRGKAMRGCLGDHSNPLPISTLGFWQPYLSVPWIKEVSATTICLLIMCLVEIQITSDFLPRLFHLSILTLFSTNSPTVMTSPATLPGSGCVMDGWDVALGSQHSLPAAHLGFPNPPAPLQGSYKETNVKQVPQISLNPWLLTGNSLALSMQYQMLC